MDHVERSRTRRLRWAPLAAALAAFTAIAAAHGEARAEDDLCQGGRVASKASEGHCCWPQQTWDAAQGMCAGRPSCPAGMSRDGLTCVAAAGAPVRAAPAPLAPRADRAPASATPSRGSGARRGLIIGGAVTFGVGYLFALVSGAIGTAVSSAYKASDGMTCGSSAPASFVPLVGPFITLAGYPGSDVRAANGRTMGCNDGHPAIDIAVWADEILQIGGAAMLATGLALRPKADTPATGTFQVIPGAAQAPAGLTVRFSAF